MNPITRPMLAAPVSLEHIRFLRYPLLATPKIDGIRCIVIDGVARSRTLKPIPNNYIRVYLSHLDHGFDGEIVCPGGFGATQSAVMSQDGTPAFKYLVFDQVGTASYETRIRDVARKFSCCRIEFAAPLIPDVIESEDDLMEAEETAVQAGYEGLCLRHPMGPYKFGRSTFKEHFLLKIKRFTDAEAMVIGFEERLHNANEATVDERGYTKRSSHSENLIPTGTLGALWVRDITTGKEFSVGTGFDDAQRQDIWLNRPTYLNQIITYKHMLHGAKDKPRHPVFKSFRLRA